MRNTAIPIVFPWFYSSFGPWPFRWESSWIGQEVGTYNIRFEVSNPSGDSQRPEQSDPDLAPVEVPSSHGATPLSLDGLEYVIFWKILAKTNVNFLGTNQLRFVGSSK